MKPFNYDALSPAARVEFDKLQRFKDYVHGRLDAAGVSADPDSPHKAEGCRIGGRLDEVFATRDALLASLESIAGPNLSYLDGTVMTGCIGWDKIVAARALIERVKGVK